MLTNKCILLHGNKKARGLDKLPATVQTASTLQPRLRLRYNYKPC